MATSIQAPKGTKDILPNEVGNWQAVERIAREVAGLYHFHEIRTPIFEHSELFHRGVGETTDIVSKETYTFKDRSDQSLTLRPEGTAGVVRAVIEAGFLKARAAVACGELDAAITGAEELEAEGVPWGNAFAGAVRGLTASSRGPPQVGWS